MIRITGGQFRGRQIHCSKGPNIRPTTAFVRESLFSILGFSLQSARMLDLFAGCGIVGIEALGRGAAQVTAIEKTGAHCRILEKNRESLGISPAQYQVLCQDVFGWATRLPGIVPEEQQFDVIYCDPPYGLPGIEGLIETCFAKGLISPQGVWIWETPSQSPPNPIEGTCEADQRRYGTSMLTFLKYPDPESSPDKPHGTGL